MTKIPKILDAKPEPTHTIHSFHGRQLMVWEGFADPTKIEGWVSNPRLELELKRFKNKFAGREPGQEEILEIMLGDKSFGLRTLAEHIHKNGVQMPLILNFNGTLLDGNRRFFAVKHLLNLASGKNADTQAIRRVPVIVLDEAATKEDEHHVLVHTNFYQDLKEPWPDFVLATYVHAALMNGDTAQAVSQRFSWSVSKVNDTKKIMGLIHEFIAWAMEEEPDGLGWEELDAENHASSKYQQFNEAQKSFYQPLLNDVDFKVQFFKWVAENKFNNFQEVRVARAAWEDPELRKILMGDTPDAAEHVRAAVAYKKVANTSTLKAAEQIASFTKFLQKMTAQEISNLQKSEIESLTVILEKVAKMAASSADPTDADN